MKNKPPAKVAVTFRLDPDVIAKLRQVSQECGDTMSSIINGAVAEFLARRSDRSSTTEPEVYVTGQELLFAAPVVQAMKRSVSLSFLVEIIKQLKTG